MNIIEQLVPEDTSIAIANENQFIYYQPSQTVNLNIRPGDQLTEETVSFKAITNRQKISEYKDEQLFGTPYYGSSIPIENDGRIHGCVTTILPREEQQFLTSLLTIRTSDRWIPVLTEDVICIEALNRKTKVATLDHRGSHKFNLRELEQLLPSDIFFRCHRSYIINLNHIVEIHPDSHSTFMLIMKDGIRVPVSQTYASEFRRLLHF